ncbi:MAG: glucose-6-phosphate isomerase [Pseudomonadota bacterium]|nr:glucose-6-phosphate isomerase [Pseudomonadota bacterium]
MTIVQDIQGCLEPGIGRFGLAPKSLATLLTQLHPALDSLRTGYKDGSMALLRVPEWLSDIDDAEKALARLSEGARTLVFFGTGGSSLGGQTIAQLGGWNIPGEMPKDQMGRPRVRFYDNLDPRTLERSLSALDLAKTRFVIISKSGNTAETLVQAICAIEAIKKAGLGAELPRLVLGLTEPAGDGTHNGLRTILESFGIPALDHAIEIGGRFSALTNVGLLPGMARGLNMRRLRQGAAAVVKALLDASGPEKFAPAVGAAVAVGLARERGIVAQVMLPYSDRLARFAHWFAQLWAESLGKDGAGTMPIAGLGPVDQHSQLQMLLDGPRHHLVTLIRTSCKGAGPVIGDDLARLAGAGYLAGRRAGDLVAAQQSAIAEALRGAGRPVRTLDVDLLDESALGGLMMHCMIETILAGHLFGVDPFGQPAVEECKRLARTRLES